MKILTILLLCLGMSVSEILHNSLVVTNAIEEWGDYNSLDSYKPTEHYVSSSWRLDFGSDFTLISWVRAIPNPNSASTSRNGVIFALSDGTVYTSGSGQRYFGISNGQVHFEALGFVSVTGTGTDEACTNVADGSWRHWVIQYTHESNILTIRVDGSLCLNSSGMTNSDFTTIPAPTGSQRVSLGYHQSNNVHDLIHGAVGHTKYYPSILSDTEIESNKGAQPNDIGFGIRVMTVGTNEVVPHIEVHYPSTPISITCIALDSSLSTPTVDFILSQSTATNTLSSVTGYAGHSDALTFGDHTLQVSYSGTSNILYCAAQNADGTVKTSQTVMEENIISFHSDYELLVSEVTSQGTPVYLPEYYWLNFQDYGSYTLTFSEATTSVNTGAFFCHQPYYTYSYGNNEVNSVKCIRLNGNVVRYDFRDSNTFKYNINAVTANNGNYHSIAFSIEAGDNTNVAIYVDGTRYYRGACNDKLPLLQPSNIILFATSLYGGLSGTIRQMRYYHRVLTDIEVAAVPSDDPNKDIPSLTINSVSSTDTSISVILEVLGTTSTSISAYALALDATAAVPLASQIRSQAAPVAITAGQSNIVLLSSLTPDHEYAVYVVITINDRIVTTDAQVLSNRRLITTKAGLSCIGFTATQGCTPYGAVDESTQYTCSSMIPSSVSGYCVCANNVHAGHTYCGHEPFNCNDICVDGIYSIQIDGWMAKTYSNFGGSITGVPTGISAYRSMNPSYNLHLSTLNYSGNTANSGSVNNIPQSEYTGLVVYHSAIFNAPTAGTYGFGVIRDDSFMLLVDSYDTSSNVVYYTSYSSSEAITNVDLEAGDHRVVVLWSNGGGGYRCTLNIYDPEGNNINSNVRVGLGTKNGVQAWYTLLTDGTCEWPASSSVSAGYGSSSTSHRNANYFPDEPNLDLYTSETRTFSTAGDVLGNNFYAVYVANLYIPNAGNYVFTLTVHGLARLTINAVSYLTMNSCESATSDSFTLFTDSGILPIHIEYLANSDTPQIKLEWESTDAGILKQVISTNYFYIEDTDPPTITLSSVYDGAMKVTETEVPITLTSSEPLLSLSPSSITIENGIISQITKVSNVEYTIIVAPSSTVAVVSVYVAANAIRANNAMLNSEPSQTITIHFGNYEFTTTIRLLEGFALDAYSSAPSMESNLYTIGIDTSVPTAYLSLEVQSETTQRDIQGYIYFSEQMLYMDSNVLEITGGSLVEGSFQAIDNDSINLSYTFTVRANAGSIVYVTVGKSTTPYYDAAGNVLSTFNSISYVYKSDSSVIIPTLSTSYVMPVSSFSVPISITFDNPVSSLSVSSFAVTAGTISNLSGSGSEYTANFTFTNPSSTSITASIQIPADTLQESNGNTNVASNILTLVYNSNVMTLTSISPSNGRLDVLLDTQTIVLTFDSEVVRGTGSAVLSCDSQTMVYPSTSENIEFSGNIVVFRITQSLIGDKTYSLVIPSYFFLDTSSMKYFNGLATGEYNFHVTCTFCSVPQITSTLPETVNLNVGMTLSLEITVSSTPAATYQWYLNDLPIDGANTLTYTAIMTESSFGLYYFIATNSLGSARSNTAIVFRSDAPPTPTIVPVISGATCASTYTVNVIWDKPVVVFDCSAFSSSSVISCSSVSAVSSMNWTVIFSITPSNYESIVIELLPGTVQDEFQNTNTGTTYEILVDCVPPAITSYYPGHQAIDILLDSTITLTFNEAVQLQEGASASLSCVSPDTCTPIEVPTSNISINSETSVVFRPSVNFDPSKTYTLVIPSNLLTDNAGNAFQGLESGTYVFTTTTAVAPALVSTVPEHLATGVALSGTITLTFDKDVMYGGSGSFLLRTANQEDIIIDGSLVSFVSSTATFVYSNLLPSSTYSVILSGSVIVETSSIHLPYTGLTEGDYQFSTLNRPDIVSFSPESGSIDLGITPSIVITYTIPVTRGTGQFVFTDGSSLISIDVNSNQVTLSSENTVVTIQPTLVPSTTYTLTAPEGIFVSSDNIPTAPISDYTITTAAPLSFTITPEANSLNNPTSFTISLHFNREIASVSNVYTINISSTSIITTVGTINSNDPTVVDYTFSSSLNPGSSYYVNVPANLVTDVLGMTNSAMDLFTYTIAPRPSVVSTVPASDATEVPVNQVFTFTFDLSVSIGSGTITLTSTSASTVSIDVTSGSCSVDGSVLTVVLPTGTTLSNGATYTVTLPEGAVHSSLNIGNALHTFTFSTPSFPVITQQTPIHQTIGIDPSEVSIVLTFSQAMTKGTGSITFTSTTSGVSSVSVDVNSSQVTVNSAVVIIEPTLVPPGTYDIVIPSGVLLSTNNAPFQGISAGAYTITTAYPADISKFIIEGTNFTNGQFSGSYTAGETVSLRLRLVNSNSENINDITGITCGGTSVSTITTSITLSNNENTISVTTQPLNANGYFDFSFVPAKVGTYTLTVRCSCGTYSNVNINHSPFTNIEIVAGSTSPTHIIIGGTGYGVNVPQLSEVYITFSTYDDNDNPTDPSNYATALAVSWELPAGYLPIESSGITRDSFGVFRYSYTAPIITANSDSDTVTVRFTYSGINIPVVATYVRFTNPYNNVCPHNCNMRQGLGVCTSLGCTCNYDGYYPEVGCLACPDTIFEPELIECNNHGTCGPVTLTQTAACTCDINYFGQSCTTLSITTTNNPNHAATESSDIIITQFTIHGFRYTNETQLQQIKLAISDVLRLSCCYNFILTPLNPVTSLKRVLYQDESSFESRTHVVKDQSNNYATTLAEGMQDGTFLYYLKREGITTATNVTVILTPTAQGPICTDLEQNGDETDVDCGGSTCSPCAQDMKCLVDSDCQSGKCDPETNTCAFVFPVWAIIVIVLVVIIVIAIIVLVIVRNQQAKNAKKPKLKVHKTVKPQEKPQTQVTNPPKQVPNVVTAPPSVTAATATVPPPVTATNPTTDSNASHVNQPTPEQADKAVQI